MKLLIVSGRSGSGKTTALHVLEDLGYYCVDNLPVMLLPSLAWELRDSNGPGSQYLAVGIDARNMPDSTDQFTAMMQDLQELEIQPEIVFLDARDEVLIHRFSATRRRHPLSQRYSSLAEAIIAERRLLDAVVSRAALYLDTSDFNVHELRDIFRERVGVPHSHMQILCESFAFKHGVPLDADLVFDARCLPNPHWHPALRDQTGLDRPVGEFLEQHETVGTFYTDVLAFLLKWIPQFRDNDRSYLTVAVGCTGGQHRSVYLAERLGKHLAAHYPGVRIRHRDLSRHDAG